MNLDNINIEETILKDLNSQLRKSEEFGILCYVLEGFGYTVVEVQYSETKKWIDVMAWFDSVCTGDYREHNGKWLIERPEDAILFKLKWA